MAPALTAAHPSTTARVITQHHLNSLFYNQKTFQLKRFYNSNIPDNTMNINCMPVNKLNKLIVPNSPHADLYS